MTKGSPQQVDQRESQRESTQLHAHLKSDGREGIGEVVDLSASGAKVRVGGPWEIGTRVQLTLEMFGLCSGTVIWCKDGLVGIKFSNESMMLALFIGGWCPLTPAKSAPQKLPPFSY